MDVRGRMHLIRSNLEVQGYTIAAKECVGIIEWTLRHVFKEQLMRLQEAERLKVHKAELNVGKGEKGVSKFTLGQLIAVYRQSGFLEAWSKASGQDVSVLRMIDLEEVNRIRNELIHEGREATRAEAELLVKAVEIILETFGMEWRGEGVESDRSITKGVRKIVPFKREGGGGRRKHEFINIDGIKGIRFGPTKIITVPERSGLFVPEARVFEEDTCLVMSADTSATDFDEDMTGLRKHLVDHQPYEPGSVVVGGRNPLKIYAIVHDLDQEPSWREEWVEAALNSLFHETERLRIRSLALPMIGTRRGNLLEERFIQLLAQSLRKAPISYLGMLWILLQKKSDLPVLEELATELGRES